MAHADWAERLERRIAAEVRRTREALGLTVQQLVERCAEHGLQIGRSTLTDWENGRRQHVPLGQLIVLARALEVSPLQLLVPVGRAETVEILPGEDHSTWDAARWFSGELSLWDLEGKPDPADLPAPRFSRVPVSGVLPLPAYRHHDELLRTWRDQVTSAPPAAESGDPELYRRMLEIAAAQLRQTEHDLRWLRREMRRQGLLPPPLPDELARVDDAADWGPAADERRRYRPQ